MESLYFLFSYTYPITLKTKKGNKNKTKQNVVLSYVAPVISCLIVMSSFQIDQIPKYMHSLST
jgi:hypothetical protein